MAITSKTRKILWGRSGNRCAICLRELVMGSQGTNSDSVIGEECHIVAREINGPRGDSPLPFDERDNVENLILLCRNHHKLVDDQPNKFTIQYIQGIKAKHEEWVRDSLSPAKQREKQGLFFAFRIDTGRQLWNTIVECDGYSFDIVQAETKEEAYLLGDFAQNIRDYGDLWNIIENRDAIFAQFEMNKQIKELNKSAFLVYGASRWHRLNSTTAKNRADLLIGYVLVLRGSNPIIQKKDDEIEMLMKTKEQQQSDFSNYVPVMIDTSSITIM
ncbi:MAG: HNH endonuclease signature motif containing protein [Chloroflexota bacterium]